LIVQFDWDEDKNQECLKLRDFDFNFASRIFEDENLKTEVDDRQDYGEKRCRVFGKIGEKLYCVIYTDRGELRRILSARRVHRNSKEEKAYYDNR